MREIVVSEVVEGRPDITLSNFVQSGAVVYLLTRYRVNDSEYDSDLIVVASTVEKAVECAIIDEDYYYEIRAERFVS